MTIRVGVDYGSDPALVHRLLLQAATEVPEVMRDPEPRTWFLSFGASSLDFELRVFVASVNDRLVVQNALHSRINALFIANGIDIAYPHLNVNLRQLPAAGN
jgi:potassium efflux system protein